MGRLEDKDGEIWWKEMGKEEGKRKGLREKIKSDIEKNGLNNIIDMERKRIIDNWKKILGERRIKKKEEDW